MEPPQPHRSHQGKRFGIGYSFLLFQPSFHFLACGSSERSNCAIESTRNSNMNVIKRPQIYNIIAINNSQTSVLKLNERLLRNGLKPNMRLQRIISVRPLYKGTSIKCQNSSFMRTYVSQMRRKKYARLHVYAH